MCAHPPPGASDLGARERPAWLGEIEAFQADLFRMLRALPSRLMWVYPVNRGVGNVGGGL